MGRFKSLPFPLPPGDRRITGSPSCPKHCVASQLRGDFPAPPWSFGTSQFFMPDHDTWTFYWKAKTGWFNQQRCRNNLNQSRDIMGFTTNNVIWVCPKIGLYIMTYDDHCNENDDQRFFWYIFSDKPKRLNGLRMDYISPFYINPRCYVRICSSGWWFETCFIFPFSWES
jgi:hypothetical protein